MNNFYVYLYIDPSKNDEVFYVGKGRNYRAGRHLIRKDKHPLTQRIQKMKKNGVSPIISKIQCSTEDIAFSLESGLIKLIGRKDLSEGTLLNLTSGGEGRSGTIFSDDYKQKCRDRMIGNKYGSHPVSDETKSKISKSLKGKPKSSDHVKKAALAKKGMKFTPEHRAKLSAAKIGNKNRLGGNSYAG